MLTAGPVTANSTMQRHMAIPQIVTLHYALCNPEKKNPELSLGMHKNGGRAGGKGTLFIFIDISQQRSVAL